MTTNPSDLLSDQSRRSVLKSGALASGAIALGLGSVQGAGAQSEGEGGNDALMFSDEFRAGAEFRIESEALDWTPNVEGAQASAVFGDYGTRIIQYTNTREEAYFFPAEGATIEQDGVYRFRQRFSAFGDDAGGEGLVAVTFEPVAEEDRVFADEADDQLDEDDFDGLDGGGEVLVRANNFFGGALLRVESEAVDWTPETDGQESDVFSEYNTRFAEYLNTGDDVQIYPAQDAQIEEGDVYVLRSGGFETVGPRGDLVVAELNEVDKESLGDVLEGTPTDGGNQTGG